MKVPFLYLITYKFMPVPMGMVYAGRKNFYPQCTTLFRIDQMNDNNVILGITNYNFIDTFYQWERKNSFHGKTSNEKFLASWPITDQIGGNEAAGINAHPIS